MNTITNIPTFIQTELSVMFQVLPLVTGLGTVSMFMM
jgi:hypothetical protein